MIFQSEDLGRYNALDKTIGKALRSCTPLEDGGIFTSGRIPLSLVEKVIRSRVPLLVSRSAPTLQAIDLATRHGLTLIGFAKGDRMNVYVAPEGGEKADD